MAELGCSGQYQGMGSTFLPASFYFHRPLIPRETRPLGQLLCGCEGERWYTFLAQHSTSQRHPHKDRWPYRSRGTGGTSRCEAGEAWPQASWITVGLGMADTPGSGGSQASISVHSKLATRQLATFGMDSIPQQKACSESFFQKEGRKTL